MILVLFYFLIVVVILIVVIFNKDIDLNISLWDEEPVPPDGDQLMEKFLNERKKTIKDEGLSEDDELKRLTCPKCGSPLKWNKTEVIYKGEKLFIQCDYCKSEVEIQL